MYRVIYTHLFEKKIKKFKKDKGLVADLKKKIEKLLSDPFIGSRWNILWQISGLSVSRGSIDWFIN